MGEIHKNHHFARCVPVRGFNLEKDKHFRGVFADDFSKPVIQVISNEAFYTPLRFQATNNKEFRTEIESRENDRIDPIKEKIFFADYRVCFPPL